MMQFRFYFFVILITSLSFHLCAEESDLAAFFKEKGSRVTTNEAGEVIKLFHGGKPAFSVADFQKIGELAHLEQLALNAPPGGDSDWGFLKDLTTLKQLTIWHGKGFSSLTPFCDLPIERLTVGGCMGLRNLNKDTPQKQRDAVLTLRGLPNLTYLNLYHSPLLPDDSHLAHVATEFSKLTELKIDFTSPRGSETSITPDGLRKLKQLPLTVFSMENISSFTPAHMKAVAEIETLEAVLIDARRKAAPEGVVEALKSARPELEVVVAGPDSKGPPRRQKK